MNIRVATGTQFTEEFLMLERVAQRWSKRNGQEELDKLGEVGQKILDLFEADDLTTGQVATLVVFLSAHVAECLRDQWRDRN